MSKLQNKTKVRFLEKKQMPYGWDSSTSFLSHSVILLPSTQKNYHNLKTNNLPLWSCKYHIVKKMFLQGFIQVKNSHVTNYC